MANNIVEGVEKVAQDAGYCVFESNSRNDPQRELAVIETFQRRRVDAIITMSIDKPTVVFCYTRQGHNLTFLPGARSESSPSGLSGGHSE